MSSQVSRIIQDRNLPLDLRANSGHILVMLMRLETGNTERLLEYLQSPQAEARFTPKQRALLFYLGETGAWEECNVRPCPAPPEMAPLT